MSKKLLVATILAFCVASSRDAMAQSLNYDASTTGSPPQVATFTCTASISYPGHSVRVVTSILFEWDNGWQGQYPNDSGYSSDYAAADLSVSSPPLEFVGRLACLYDFYIDGSYNNSFFIGWFTWPPT
jgi:hypothetical protein